MAWKNQTQECLIFPLFTFPLFRDGVGGNSLKWEVGKFVFSGGRQPSQSWRPTWRGARRGLALPAWRQRAPSGRPGMEQQRLPCAPCAASKRKTALHFGAAARGGFSLGGLGGEGAGARGGQSWRAPSFRGLGGGPAAQPGVDFV